MKSFKICLFLITFTIGNVIIESSKELQAAYKFERDESSDDIEDASEPANDCEPINDYDESNWETDDGNSTNSIPADRHPILADRHPIFILVGTSSSGKSTLTRILKKKIRFSRTIALDDISTKQLNIYNRRHDYIKQILEKQSQTNDPLYKISDENFALTQKIIVYLKTQAFSRHLIIGDTCLGKFEDPEWIKAILRNNGINNVYIIYVYCPLEENLKRLEQRNNKSPYSREQRRPEQVSDFFGTYVRGASPDDQDVASDTGMGDLSGSFFTYTPETHTAPVFLIPPPMRVLGITSSQEVHDILKDHGNWSDRGGTDRQLSRIVSDLRRSEEGKQTNSPTNTSPKTPLYLVPRYKYDYVVNTTKKNHRRMLLQFILDQLR